MSQVNGATVIPQMLGATAPVFTTGAVAKVCKVAPRTVSKWFDSGRLLGYHIPGSRTRRVPLENLLAFLRESGMPVPAELERVSQFRVLLVGVSGDLADRLDGALAGTAGLRVERCDHVFDAGLMVHEFRPHAAVVDLSVGRGDAARIAAAVRRSDPPARTRPRSERVARVGKGDPVSPDAAVLVALAGEDGLNHLEELALAEAGFDRVVPAPVDAAALADLIRGGREG